MIQHTLKGGVNESRYGRIYQEVSYPEHLDTTIKRVNYIKIKF